MVTDISHIKNAGVAIVNILDTYDDSCQLFYCTDAKAIAGTDAQLPKISPREIEVLRLPEIGHSSKQMAAALNIAVKTIDNQLQSLLHKINTKFVSELVAYAINRGGVYSRT